MGTHHGKDGVVKVGANAVAEVQEFSVEESVETADDTAMGDASEQHLVGITSWNGSMRCHWSETDTNGQQALTIGASVTLNLYPEGAGAGATYKTGTATITRVGLAASRNGIVTRDFSFKGNGALSETTVGA
jgi:hypothetical protein